MNKNSVPQDQRSPFVTSGLRMGTPAMTQRGMKEAQAEQIAHWICDVLDQMEDTSVQQRIAEEVKALCRQFPVYQDLNA